MKREKYHDDNRYLFPCFMEDLWKNCIIKRNDKCPETVTDMEVE